MSIRPPSETLCSRFDMLQKRLQPILEEYDAEKRKRRQRLKQQGVHASDLPSAVSLGDLFTAHDQMSEKLRQVSHRHTISGILRATTTYDSYTTGLAFLPSGVFGACTKSAADLRRDENELNYVARKLAAIEETELTPLTWRDYTEAWEALIELRSKILVNRGQSILRAVVNDLAVSEGLGAAFQMLKVSGGVPDEIMQKLNEGPANHIRRNAFKYKFLIDKELFGIKRVKEIRAGVLSAVSGFFVAALIGFFQNVFEYIFNDFASTAPDESPASTSI